MGYNIVRDKNNFILDTHYGMCDAVVSKAMELFDNYHLKILKLNHYDKIFYINNLYIETPYLNKGLGKMLLNTMLDYAKNHKFNNIYLTAEPVGHKNFDLFQLVEFYKRRGFVVITGNSFTSLMKYGKPT